MHELTFSRHNPHIDPAMTIWEWQIPIYLFLGGLVAGMMILYGYFHLRDASRPSRTITTVLPLMSLVLISAGMFALFLDLGHKLYVWQLYMTFQPTSPMSWGAWILLQVYPLLFAAYLIGISQSIPAFLLPWKAVLVRVSTALQQPRIMRALSISHLVVGIALGIYTGVLLSTLGARPLWNSGVLWMLFLVSGVSTAAAFVHMITKDEWEQAFLAKVDNIILGVELVVLVLFLIGLLSSSAAHQSAAALLLTGSYAASFWVFVIGMGIVVPLFLQINAVRHRIQHTIIIPIAVLAGGLALRFIIVLAGQESSWIATIHTHANLFR